VYVDHRCDAETTLRAVDRIVEINKPAHTTHRSEAVYADARIGLQSRVGLDLFLGAAQAPGLRIGPGGPQEAATIGIGTVLGSQRPGYVRRLED
jgi:hypothetical protein